MWFEKALEQLAAGSPMYHAVLQDPFTSDSHDQDHLQSFAEFGVKFKVPCDALRKWLSNFTAETGLNAVYFDTTTLGAINQLLRAPQTDSVNLTPAALWDLGSFVTAVVLCDHIFHLENPLFDPFVLNEALGNEPILIGLPVTSVGARLAVDNPGEPSTRSATFADILEALWDSVVYYMQENLHCSGPGTIFAEDVEEIATAWQLLFNFDDKDSRWLDYGLHQCRDTYASNGPELLATLTDLELVVGRGFRLRRPKDIYELMNECNYRSFFNIQVSNLLGLQYIPNSFRLPFRRFLYKRARTIQFSLSTIRQIETEYKLLTAAYFVTDTDNLQLPFFLTAVLSRISSLDEFFEVLGQMRLQATGFRKHRVEMDEALRSGNVAVAKKIRDALAEDGKGLLRAFPLAAVAGATASVLAALTAHLGPSVLTAIAFLSATSQLPPDQFKRLSDRVLRPQFHFLGNAGEAAKGLSNAYPKVRKLWNVDKYNEANGGDEAFVKQFGKLAKLQY